MEYHSHKHTHTHNFWTLCIPDANAQECQKRHPGQVFVSSSEPYVVGARNQTWVPNISSTIESNYQLSNMSLQCRR